MGHQITQIARTENGGKYKVSISIPFELGWIERVKLNITTRTQKNVYPMQHIKNEGDMAYFETTIELPRYAVYHYYFSFEANSRFQYYKKENTSGDNSVTDEEYWKMSVGFNVPEWAKGAMMYHIFIDKYRRTKGLEKKQMPGRKIHENWYEKPVIGPDEDGNWNVDFHCGDLKGITDTIKYLKRLGVEILYLSPIVKSQSNHRYDAGDYKTVDPYAGTNEMLAELCEKAHKNGMKVILDSVFNHTGNDSIYYNEYGHYDSIGAYQVEKDPKYAEMKSPYSNFYAKECHYGNYDFIKWWGMPNLPVCDGNSSEWVNFICGKGGVIDCWFDLGIDGLRLDVTDELLDSFVEQIYIAVTRNKKDGLIIAEIWEQNPMNRSYLASTRGFHSLMDYTLVDALMRFYKYADTRKLSDVLRFIYTEYPTETIQTLMNFTSTHDISRPIEVFGSNAFNPYAQWCWDLPQEKANNYEWIRNHQMTREEYKYGKMTYKSYCFVLAFLPGIFSIFYGDEVGVKGIGNLANRAPYPWKYRDKDLLKYFRQLGTIHKTELFLRKAEFKKVKITNEQFVFERYDEKNKIIIFASRTHNYSNVELPKEYENSEVVFKIGKSNEQQLSPFGAIALKRK